MLITDYTSYDEIRAALGVSEDDIEDATLALPLYADILAVELEDISLDLPDTYATLKDNPTPSLLQRRFLQSARLFATYAIAKHLSGSLPLFSPETVTDSKVSVKRFTSPYKDVIANVGEQYGRFRKRLEEAYAAVSSTTATARTPKVYFSVSAPSSDPVTGT